MGMSLQGKKVLVLGYGAVAQALIQILRPFNCDMTVLRRTWEASQKNDLEKLNIGLLSSADSASLKATLSETDIVFVACTLTDSTRGMINRDWLSNMKDRSFLVNVARGGILDYDSITHGLKSGKLAGLGLDVFWQEPFDPSDPILSFDNVIVTPHIGGVTDVSYGNMAKLLVSTVSTMQKGVEEGVWNLPKNVNMIVSPKSLDVKY